jgi:hypothetical protein
MDYFYDGQIRRYVTQFMRVFIGFKYQAGDGEQREVPVNYGDITRQVAAIVKDNSENKMSSVPKISCYLTGLEMDTTRLGDPTFISKVNIRERSWTAADGTIEYGNSQGGGYTVERLMPTPFKLTMKADIWTSNTDQKLQLMEQILVLFNPSLEIQTTDNYIDWTSLSVLDLRTITFSSRSIPQGAESEIDICTLEFEMPVYLTPPAKVKKLGIVKNIIANVFTEKGEVLGLEDLVYNGQKPSAETTAIRYRVLLFKSENGQPYDYNLTLVNPEAAVVSQGIDMRLFKTGDPVDWNSLLTVLGGYRPGNQVSFEQPNGFSIVGTYVINPIDPTVIVVTFDQDTIPENTLIPSSYRTTLSTGTIDAIVDPTKYNPVIAFNGIENIPVGHRLLILEDIGADINVDGADAWAEYTPNVPRVDANKIEDLVVSANSILEWDGIRWNVIFDPVVHPYTGLNFVSVYIQNLRTGIKYRWDGEQWLKAFEGEYAPGYWTFLAES